MRTSDTSSLRAIADEHQGFDDLGQLAADGACGLPRRRRPAGELFDPRIDGGRPQDSRDPLYRFGPVALVRCLHA
jgi:hypothetical protein